MIPLFLILCGALFLWMTGWYWVARFLGRTDIVDMVWGLSYGLIALILFIVFSPPWLAIFPLVFVIVWSVRLVTHILHRLRNHSEDSRYATFRVSWGQYFYLKSYLFIFLLQGLFIAIISLPLLFLFTKDSVLTPQFSIGAVLWIVGFLCEYLADRQMNIFRANTENTGKIIQTGLWKYSRHPNYFGELLMWWSLWLMSLNSVESFIGILSPLLLTYLIVFVTGIPLLEKALTKRQGFDTYKKTTNILIPGPRKNTF